MSHPNIKVTYIEEIPIKTAGSVKGEEGRLFVAITEIAGCGDILNEDGIALRFEYQRAGFVVSLAELEAAIAEVKKYRAGRKPS